MARRTSGNGKWAECKRTWRGKGRTLFCLQQRCYERAIVFRINDSKLFVNLYGKHSTTPSGFKTAS